MNVEPAFICARQREKTLHKVGHSRCFMKCFLECNHSLRLRRLAHGPLDVRAQNSERRLQLMARVCGKPAKTKERSLEPLDHVVKSRHKSFKLFTRVFDAEPSMQTSPVTDCGNIV